MHGICTGGEARTLDQRLAAFSSGLRLVILDLRGIRMDRAMITRSWTDSPPPDRAGNACYPWDLRL